MSSADTPPFSEEVVRDDEGEAREPKASAPLDDLAAFSVLADPAEIAGDAPTTESDQQTVVDRLRAELQRRAMQVERMSRDLGAAKASAEASSEGSEAGWKSVGTASTQPRASAPAQEEAGLKRLLHAAHRARHDLQERLQARDGEFDELRREKKELSSALDAARAELASAAGERERVNDLMSNLTTRSAAYERLSDECNSLRRGLVEAQREAAEARKASERNREVLGETRNRVAEREAEASALRAALATNQKQAQARECDNDELKAALSIASETLEARRAELRQARAELEATSRRLSESELKATRLENELQAQHDRTHQQTSELAKLKEAVPRLESEVQERQSEAETLRQRLTAQQSELVDAREALSQSRLKCEGLADDLENEREAHRRARERASEREATVSKLHETLASIGKAASVFPLTETGGENVEAAPRQDVSGDDATSEIAEPEATSEPLDAAEADVALDEATNEEEAAVEATPEVEKHAAAEPIKRDDRDTPLAYVVPARGSVRPAIFDLWRDQQVARKLSSLDIADTEGFFARHIAAAANLPKGDTLEVLSLGGEEPDFELRIARRLRKQGQHDFRIHFPQGDAAQTNATLARAASAGIDTELAPFDADAWMQAGLPEHFHVIIGDGALSRSTQLVPFVDSLESAAREGSQLALAERIGRGESRTAREMGERVWRLMPERYKYNHVTDEVDGEYASHAEAVLDVDILALLRSRFAFEDYASFGHLVDRFIGAEIGPNFDPEDDRDRRFIEQIANLDEAKLDSGTLRPLHMMARLSPRDDEER